MSNPDKVKDQPKTPETPPPMDPAVRRETDEVRLKLGGGVTAGPIEVNSLADLGGGRNRKKPAEKPEEEPEELEDTEEDTV